jgi:hypothetical protein
MTLLHGSLVAGDEIDVDVSTDVRQAGVLHKGGAAPIYARWDGEETAWTILPGMRRWIPAPRNATRSRLYLQSSSNCEWEIES